MDMLDENLQAPLTRKEWLKKAGAAAATVAASGTLLTGFRPSVAPKPTPAPTPVVSTLGHGTKTINVWDGLGGPDGATFSKMLSLFVQQNSDVRIEHQVLEWGVYYQKVPTAILAGSPPDLIVNDAYGLPQFANRSMLQPLEDLVFGKGRLHKTDFSAQQLHLGTWNAQLYGLPLWNPIIGFWINTDLVRKAGLNPQHPPMTGAAFTEWAIRLTKDMHGRRPDQKGFDPRNIDIYGVSMGWPFHSMISTLWQYGGDVTNATHTKSTLDSPQSVAALEYWVNLINHHTHVPIVMPYVPATGTFYASNRLAMVVEGSWWLNYFRQHPSVSYPRTVHPPLPKWGPQKKAVWWTGHVMSIPQGISAQNADIVARLIAFLSDQASWGALAAGHLPARLSQQRNPKIANDWWMGSLVRDQREDGRLEWYSPSYNQMYTYFMAAWGAALTGSQPPRAALHQATQLINGIL